MNFIDEIKIILTKATQLVYFEVDVNNLPFVVEVPKDRKLGDYASNIALQLCKMVKANPKLIAAKLVEKINLTNTSFARVEVAGAGFINFFAKTSALTNIITTINQEQENFGKTTLGKGKTIDVEFISANPTGKLHLGHAREAALGDSICRVLNAAGYKVTREYYVNDAGNQIHNLALSLQARYQECCGATGVLPEDGYHGEEIITIAKKLYSEVGAKYVNNNSKEAYNFFRSRGIEENLNQIKEDLKLFRVVMDIYSSEATIRSQGMIEHTLDIYKEIGASYVKDGATWLKSTDYGDDKDRVLIKSDGSYTYLVPDIAYHINKLQRGFDYLVDLLGADHHGYISRLKASIMALGQNPDVLSVDIVQMVRLIKDGQEFKMSKRTGNAVTLTDLIDEVGVDAARYFFVARSGSTHLDFDIGLAKSQSNENPVYYAQYAHARMASILKSSLELKKPLPTTPDLELLVAQQETNLLLTLQAYSDVINEAASTREPYKIANYIQQLAQNFHSFYNECRVIDADNLELSGARLSLVKATKIVLKNALDLIGVSAPESM